MVTKAFDLQLREGWQVKISTKAHPEKITWQKTEVTVGLSANIIDNQHSGVVARFLATQTEISGI